MYPESNIGKPVFKPGKSRLPSIVNHILRQFVRRHRRDMFRVRCTIISYYKLADRPAVADMIKLLCSTFH